MGSSWTTRGAGGVIRPSGARILPWPSANIPIKDAAIDWSRTVAWGDEGYYGFLKVKGREPEGIVEPSRYEEVRGELTAKLETMTG